MMTGGGGNVRGMGELRAAESLTAAYSAAKEE